MRAPALFLLYMGIYDYLQIVGGVLLVIAFLPQILKMIRTRSVDDMSLSTFVMNFVAVGFMEIYAWNLWRTHDQPAFLITNTLGWIVAGTLLGLILRYRRNSTL